MFLYRRADGSTVRELRHPDDVFHADHLASLRQLPITNDHPAAGMVTADNYKRLAVGSTGERVDQVGGRYLESPIMIGDKQAVEDVTSGRKVQTSLGYQVAIVDESGTFNGQRYDKRQTGMLANHLALVIHGRAGGQVGVRLDSQDAVLLERLDGDDAKQDQQGAGRMAKIRIDGADYEIPDSVAPVVAGKVKAADTEKARADALDSKLEKVQAERDALEVRADKAEKAAADAKTGITDEQRADAMKAARARLALEDQAKAQGLEFKADATDAELRDQLIGKLAPKLSLEGRSDDAKAAMLDVLLEGARPSKAGTAGREALAGKRTDSKDNDTRTDSEEAFLAAYAGAGYGTEDDAE